jgi:hypothetical protein
MTSRNFSGLGLGGSRFTLILVLEHPLTLVVPSCSVFGSAANLDATNY